jgi:tyrosyl-tRNA synthetase
MVAQGAVSIDGNRVTDSGAQVEPRDGMVTAVGKRKLARIKIIKGRTTAGGS